MGSIPSFPVLGPHFFLFLLEAQFSHPVLALVHVRGIHLTCLSERVCCTVCVVTFSKLSKCPPAVGLSELVIVFSFRKYLLCHVPGPVVCSGHGRGQADKTLPRQLPL